jgi:hypothetical protein
MKDKAKDEKKPIKEAELDKVNAGHTFQPPTTAPPRKGPIAFGPKPIKWV